jgi:hypothetical protein
MSQNTNIIYPDIEIYLADTTNDEIVNWLDSILSDINLTRSSRDKGTCRYSARYLNQQGEREIQFIIIEYASGDFTSLWFKSGQTPWPSDLECARAAADHFSQEIRCSPGSWNPNQDNDEWISIRNAHETTVAWRS